VALGSDVAVAVCVGSAAAVSASMVAANSLARDSVSARDCEQAAPAAASTTAVTTHPT
jgi:hypothetical protein